MLPEAWLTKGTQLKSFSTTYQNLELICRRDGYAYALSAARRPHGRSLNRDGCHRWHNCLSDRGAYVCGDTGCLTQAQRTWLEALAQCPGVEVHVWRPADWPLIVERLKK